MTPSTKNDVLEQFHGFLNTPPLWRKKQYFEFEQFLLTQKEIPKNLPAPEIRPNLVLGKRIERFFRFYIEHLSEEEVLAENIQIISDKVTLGELDFILKNKKTGRICHVEVVYKFYLYDPLFENEPDRWIGPNRKDSLVRKITHLKNQQFPLLYRKETQPLLEELGIIPEEVKQNAFFRAHLFVPFSMTGKNLPLINNNCIAGFWIRFTEFNQSGFGNYQFYSPKKPDWPIDPYNGKIWYSYEEIRKQLSVLLKKQKSPLLWIRKSPREFCRIFVVWW